MLLTLSGDGRGMATLRNGPSHSREAHSVGGGATRRLFGQTRGVEKVNSIGGERGRGRSWNWSFRLIL
jgi:hypothetical protein